MQSAKKLLGEMRKALVSVRVARINPVYIIRAGEELAGNETQLHFACYPRAMVSTVSATKATVQRSVLGYSTCTCMSGSLDSLLTLVCDRFHISTTCQHSHVQECYLLFLLNLRKVFI